MEKRGKKRDNINKKQKRLSNLNKGLRIGGLDLDRIKQYNRCRHVRVRRNKRRRKESVERERKYRKEIKIKGD